MAPMMHIDIVSGPLHTEVKFSIHGKTNQDAVLALSDVN